MPASTNLDFATLLAPLMRAAAGMTETAVRTQLTTILGDWAQGDAAFNRANAKVIQAIDDGDLIRMEFADWKAGTATGGPNGDGEYPMTMPDGTVEMVPGLAKLMADQAAAVAALNASGAVLETDDWSLDAIPYSSSEDTAQTALMDWLKYLSDNSLPWPSADRLLLMADLFTALVESGVWADLDAFYLFAQADADVSRVNLRNPALGLLLAVDSPDFLADAGWKGDGVAARLQPAGAAYPGAPQQNNASLGMWVTEAGTTGISIYTGNGRMTVSGANTTTRINNATTFTLPGSTGFFHSSRGGSTDGRGYSDDNAEVVSAVASSAAANRLEFLAANGGTGTNARLGGGWVGRNLTVGKARSLRRLLGVHFRDLARIS